MCRAHLAQLEGRQSASYGSGQHVQVGMFISSRPGFIQVDHRGTWRTMDLNWSYEIGDRDLSYLGYEIQFHWALRLVLSKMQASLLWLPLVISDPAFVGLYIYLLDKFN